MLWRLWPWMGRLCFFLPILDFPELHSRSHSRSGNRRVYNQSLKDVRPTTFTSIAGFAYIKASSNLLPLQLYNVPPPTISSSVVLPSSTIWDISSTHIYSTYLVTSCYQIFPQLVWSCSHCSSDHWSRHLVHLPNSTTTIAFFLTLTVTRLQQIDLVAASTPISSPTSTAVNGTFYESFDFNLVSSFDLFNPSHLISTIEETRS